MLMLVAPALAADPAPLPTWDLSTGEHVGAILTHIGLYGMGSGLAAATVGDLLMETDRCVDCFEPDSQWVNGEHLVLVGVLGMVTAAPLAVAGPVVTATARHRSAVALAVVPAPHGIGVVGTF